MTNLLLTLYLSTLFATAPTIDVVYPRPTGSDTLAHIAKVDSNFIFGSVTPPESELTINGTPVELHPDGAFLAYIPIDWDRKTYKLQAMLNEETTESVVHFDTPKRRRMPRPEPNVTFPRYVTLMQSIARNDPRGTFYLFPDSGTTVYATGWENGYYQIPLEPNSSIWVDERYVWLDDVYQGQTVSAVWGAKLQSVEGWVELSIPFGRRLLYKIRDERIPNRIEIDFFGVISHLDQISYPPGTELVDEIRWDEPTDQTMKLTILLTDESWGYGTRWEDGKFILSMKKPPTVKRNVKGLRITIDPGHGGKKSFGSIGPTRLTEKDINLAVSLELAAYLEKKGAEVKLTRTDDYEVELGSRTQMAVENSSDLLISIHHNALADGINPFSGKLGSGTYYYNPQSRDLAAAIQHEIIEELELPNEGIFYRDFSLTRPTEMPSVLIEIAYMMLPEQEQLLKDEDYPRRISKAIYKGIKQFRNNRQHENNHNNYRNADELYIFD